MKRKLYKKTLNEKLLLYKIVYLAQVLKADKKFNKPQASRWLNCTAAGKSNFESKMKEMHFINILFELSSAKKKTARLRK